MLHVPFLSSRELPGARVALAAVLLAGALCAQGAGSRPTEADCNEDRRTMLAAVAESRAREVRMLNAAITAAPTDYERDRLRDAMERAWDDEEEQRAIADQIWRDCLAYARRTRTPSS